LKPITYANATISKNFAPAWKQLGTFNGKQYALVFKAANKSLVWYNVPAFKTAGVKPPKTWTQLLGREGHPVVGHARVLDRRGGRVDPNRPVREHLSTDVRCGEVRVAECAQDQVDRSVGHHGVKDDGADPQ